MAEKDINMEKSFTVKVERLLVKAVLIGMLLIVGMQFIMLNDSARVFLNYTASLEGGSLGETGILTKEGSVFLELESEELMPQVKLLVNGEPIASFDKGEIEVVVKNNDLLEMDAVRVTDEYVHVSVVGVTDNILQPSVGLRIRAKNRIETISRVRLK